MPRGQLDQQAAIEVTKNPSLTYAQLAEMLRCNSSTLRNRRRCPLLAAAIAKIKAEKERFRRGNEWNDRRDDDE